MAQEQRMLGWWSRGRGDGTDVAQHAEWACHRVMKCIFSYSPFLQRLSTVVIKLDNHHQMQSPCHLKSDWTVSISIPISFLYNCFP